MLETDSDEVVVFEVGDDEVGVDEVDIDKGAKMAVGGRRLSTLLRLERLRHRTRPRGSTSSNHLPNLEGHHGPGCPFP
jgi:hypothetical protein